MRGPGAERCFSGAARVACQVPGLSVNHAIAPCSRRLYIHAFVRRIACMQTIGWPCRLDGRPSKRYREQHFLTLAGRPDARYATRHTKARKRGRHLGQYAGLASAQKIES